MALGARGTTQYATKAIGTGQPFSAVNRRPGFGPRTGMARQVLKADSIKTNANTFGRSKTYYNNNRFDTRRIKHSGFSRSRRTTVGAKLGSAGRYGGKVKNNISGGSRLFASSSQATISHKLHQFDAKLIRGLNYLATERGAARGAAVIQGAFYGGAALAVGRYYYKGSPTYERRKAARKQKRVAKFMLKRKESQAKITAKNKSKREKQVIKARKTRARQVAKNRGNPGRLKGKISSAGRKRRTRRNSKGQYAGSY